MFTDFLKPEILQFGSTVVALASFVLVAYLVRELRKNGFEKHTEAVAEAALSKLEDNHMHEWIELLRKIDERTETMVRILTRLEERIKQ